MQIVFILITFSALFLYSLTCESSVNEYKLDNGLKVLIIEDTKTPLATFQIWYRVGSKDEPHGKTGISHLLEHMMFKGTKKYSSKEFSNIIQKNGGVDNAFTTKDYTMYYQTLPSSKVYLSIELESDRMNNLLLAQEDVESEKKVVMEERRMRYEDDPHNSLFEEVIATALKVSSYRWPVIGWMSDIASITRDDLYYYYKRFYCPDNAFIVVTGDVSSTEIFRQIKEKFGGIPRCQSDPQNKSFNSNEPEQKGPKRLYLKKEAELPYILLAYHTPSFPHEDSYALEVLSILLSGGKSSRLYRELVYQKRIALNILAEYNGLYKHPFLFFIGATSSPEQKIEDIEKAIEIEIEKLKKEPPLEKEIERVKNQIESSFIFAQDSNFSKGLYTGLFELLGNWDLLNQYLEGIRKVKPEDIVRVVNKYLIEDRKTVGILIPIKRTI